MNFQIKSRWDSRKVLFECELSAEVADRIYEVQLGFAVRQAVSSGARLDGARLVGASLDGASLDGARLDGASLVGASLDGASLVGARLDGARLVGARLDGARLDGASLDGASLDGDLKLIGKRPFFCIGPIGSRNDYLYAWITDKGLRVSAGCFRFKTVDKFRKKLEYEHGDNEHAQEYLAALILVEHHAKLWTPATTTEETK